MAEKGNKNLGRELRKSGLKASPGSGTFEKDKPAIVMKTKFFERVFGVDIKDFPTTEDIDKFIKKVRGGKDIEIVHIETPLITTKGSIFPIQHYDIEKLVDEACKN